MGSVAILAIVALSFVFSYFTMAAATAENIADAIAKGDRDRIYNAISSKTEAFISYAAACVAMYICFFKMLGGSSWFALQGPATFLATWIIATRFAMPRSSSRYWVMRVYSRLFKRVMANFQTAYERAKHTAGAINEAEVDILIRMQHHYRIGRAI